MEIGISRFVFADHDAGAPATGRARNPVTNLLAEMELADQVGIDIFGIGEHHTREFLDAAPPLLLAAGAARTQRLRLTSAITILSVADPVRVFQEFATLDLISQGRAEMIVGRGAYAEAFALFGLSVGDYDALFEEKLGLLLALRARADTHWRGRYRPPLTGQGVYPRPVQAELPIWLGVGGTPASAVRAGTLGLPLALGVLGGEYAAYRPLLDLYREAGHRAGHPPERLRVNINALGYVADTAAQAQAEFFPPYAAIFGELGRKAGWPPITPAHFAELTGPTAALVVGGPAEVARKIQYIDKVLGGIARISLQMSVGPVPHAQRLRSVELLGTAVAPQLRSG